MTLRDLTRAMVPNPNLTVKLQNIYEDELGALLIDEEWPDAWKISDEAYPIVTMDSTICEISFSGNLIEIMVHSK